MPHKRHRSGSTSGAIATLAREALTSLDIDRRGFYCRFARRSVSPTSPEAICFRTIKQTLPQRRHDQPNRSCAVFFLLISDYCTASILPATYRDHTSSIGLALRDQRHFERCLECRRTFRGRTVLSFLPVEGRSGYYQSRRKGLVKVQYCSCRTHCLYSMNKVLDPLSA